MKAHALTAVAAVAAGAAALIAPATAHAATAVEDCLAARPGAVTVAAVTPGDDTVCVGPTDVRVASAGNDTYLWVGTTAQAADKLTGDTIDDPGDDTLSLALWTTPWTESFAPNGFGGMFGVRVFINVENIVYTPLNDRIGDPAGCGRLTANNGIGFALGAGDDTVNCVAGEISTGTGADVVRGVALGTTVHTGAGNDLAVGDANGDVIVLGSGADTAKVEAGGADTVSGGAGADTVFASRNDAVSSAQVR